MKKLTLATLIALASYSVQAHDVWVQAPVQMPENQILNAELGYGHFPIVEEIAAKRLNIFAPMQLVDSTGKIIDLKQQGKNYQYVSEKPLAKGTYWVTATYKPTFWSHNAEDKWGRANLEGMKDAVYCEQTQMFAKSAVVVGNEFDAAIYAEPVGQALEIIPLGDPAKAKAGESFPVQVIYEGKPLAGETLIATADTVVAQDFEAAEDHREPQGFSGKTDKNGKINFIPLVEGLWKIKVIHKAPFANQKQCQHVASYATLVLPVGEKRAHIEHHHHEH